MNNKKDTLSVNANHVHYGKGGKGKNNKGRNPRNINRSKGNRSSLSQGNRQNQDNPRNESTSPRTQPKGKGKGRGTNRSFKGSRQQPSQGNCSYCDRPGHYARECRKRMKDEANKTTRPIQTQNVTELNDDELTLIMTQNVTHVGNITDPLPVLEDSSLQENQRFTPVLGEFTSHPIPAQRQRNRDNVIIECDLSTLFSNPTDEPDLDTNAPTPPLPDQGSSSTEHPLESSSSEPTWGTSRPADHTTDLHIWETTNLSTSVTPMIYYRERDKCTSYILTSTKVFHSSSTFTCVPCLDENPTTSLPIPPHT